MSEPRPPITAIDTSTAAFIGHIPDSNDPPGMLHRPDSWMKFVRLARPSPNSGQAWNDLSHAVNGFFLNGGALRGRRMRRGRRARAGSGVGRARGDR